MDEINEEAAAMFKEQLAISRKIRENTREWKKTKSVSLAFETMELLSKIVPEKEQDE